MELTTSLFLVNALLFVMVGYVLAIRVRDVEGSLLLAKTSVVLTAFSAALTLTLEAVRALVFQNGLDAVLVAQLYVPQDLFAMLTLGFLASFGVFATYAGPRRKLMIALFFVMALIPPTYLALTISSAQAIPTGNPEVFNFIEPPLTHALYAICGIPLGIAPLLVFIRSFALAIERGDKALSTRSAVMLLAVAINEAAYLFFTFGTGLVETGALIAWIPAALFLLFAVLKTTSPIQPTEEE